MDFTLSDEQAQFRDVMRRWVAEQVRPVASRYEREGIYPDELVAAMGEMGLFGMLVPERFGGLELDAVSYGIVFEEISKAWMGLAGILGSHSLATNLILKYGTDEQRERYLPDLATGARRSGIGLTEPGAGSDLQGISTTATLDGDHYVVNGTKTWITNARHADPLPVLVKTDPSADPSHRGMSVLLIDGDTPGFTVSKDIGKLGYKGPESCEVVLEDARVPVGNLLGGTEGTGLKQALSALEIGRVNIAARAIGIATASLEQSLDYAKQREAFGQPISEFQAIKLKLADMATKIEAGRLLMWWAADRFDSGERTDRESGMAKLFCSEVAIECSLEAMRIHGGYGYSTEFEIERLYRDAPLMAIGEGTNDILRLVIARSLLRDGL
ncbi:acyl-CoA dehydrogenase family protein [Euzebya tangerina]|uniref:acyl-CoA dehydrogenase family protein n=1 Tax=Euzebya tangerina TaxID=591198 RepID=UPI000E319D4C|nr:acyl-CoA dehydrogenase family protein [Euzebya tangerina]